MKKNNAVKSVLVLMIICVFIADAMAAVNMLTEPRIAEVERQAKQSALSAVITENGGFELVELSDMPDTVTEIYKDRDGNGYVVLLNAKGYDSSKPISLAVGFSNGGTITKLHVISCNGETAGIGTVIEKPDFTEQFSQKDASLNGVDAVSGATVSSDAVINAVKDAFVAFDAAKEGS